jgi:hypothetical protein
MKTLLSRSNPKLRKGEKEAWLTYGLMLLPHKMSGKNFCAGASPQCIAYCLNWQGRGGIGDPALNSCQKARFERSRLFIEERHRFMDRLFAEIAAAYLYARKRNKSLAVRLNTLSDIPWENIKVEGKSVFEHFPYVQFYDYTKVISRLRRPLPPNYHLTFSRSENNGQYCLEAISLGFNVAVVFRSQLPASHGGMPVHDGDETDLRFLDPRGSICGLVAKGKAKKAPEGFVVT